MWVRFLGQRDPLEDGMATHSSILAWRIPWTLRGGLKRIREDYRALRQENAGLLGRVREA